MLENSSRNRKLLAGVVGVNLALALAVSAGAVPHVGGDGPVRTAAVSRIQEVAAPEARQPGDASPQPASQAAVAGVPGSAATVRTTAATPRTTDARATTAALPTKAPIAKVAPAALPPVVTAPAGAVTVRSAPLRRTPSAAEVQAAINELKRQVGGLLLLVSPTPAQLAQAGDQVCTAFDNGQNLTQVKATGLSLIPAAIPVSPATVDWAVRRGVALYCPGHADKLV